MAKSTATLETAAQYHSAMGEEQAVQLRSVKQSADAVRSEIENLRLAVKTHDREDAIYLKSLILKPDLDPALARNIATLVSHYCDVFGRDPNLVLAIMSVESNFNPRAVSSAGAIGLMQVMPHWKKVLRITGDMTDPETSIRFGLQILAIYQEMYEELSLALNAYNQGPGPVDAALRKGVRPDNGYAPKVMATFDKLRRIDSSGVEPAPAAAPEKPRTVADRKIPTEPRAVEKAAASPASSAITAP